MRPILQQKKILRAGENHQEYFLEDILSPPLTNKQATSSCLPSSQTEPAMDQKALHFLIVTFPAQGHLNPSRHLAKRLAGIAAGTRITLSTTISGHHRMFPSISSPDQQVQDGEITYIPFSDGNDDGSTSRDFKTYLADLELIGSRHIDEILRSLAASDHPVTCLIYTLLLPWAGRVAREHNVPSAQFWIQSTTVLAIWYHFFHGHHTLISSHSKSPSFHINLPNLPPMQIRDIPTFLTITDHENPAFCFLSAFEDTIEAMKSGEKVLVNTFYELEPDVLGSMREYLDVFAIGPVMPQGLENTYDLTPATRDLFGEDSSQYMEWLDEQDDKSVVYVSFGSNLVLNQKEIEEIRRGLKATGRPYLWVTRMKKTEAGGEKAEKGMEIEWCAQLKVLSHRSVGCFVTHCGWNSTAESLVMGVPVVAAMASWADQTTNAWMAEREWGVGMRMEEVEAEEVRKCVEIVMAGGERGEEIRRKAAMWKDRVRKAIGEGGSSDRNLRAFVEGIRSITQNL